MVTWQPITTPLCHIINLGIHVQCALLCTHIHIHLTLQHTFTRIPMSLQNFTFSNSPLHTHPHTLTLTHSPSHAGVICPLPGLLEHDHIASLGQLYFCGTMVRFHCQRGYRLVGSRRCTCQANGTWSDSFPSCQPQGKFIVSQAKLSLL